MCLAGKLMGLHISLICYLHTGRSMGWLCTMSHMHRIRGTILMCRSGSCLCPSMLNIRLGILNINGWLSCHIHLHHSSIHINVGIQVRNREVGIVVHMYVIPIAHNRHSHLDMMSYITKIGNHHTSPWGIYSHKYLLLYRSRGAMCLGNWARIYELYYQRISQ